MCGGFLLLYVSRCVCTLQIGIFTAVNVLEIISLIAFKTMGLVSSAGANVQFGPAVNVQRVANGGRSFEYLSGEDPFLGYTLVQPIVKGIQSQGVITNAKHYLGNLGHRAQAYGNRMHELIAQTRIDAHPSHTPPPPPHNRAHTYIHIYTQARTRAYKHKYTYTYTCTRHPPNPSHTHAHIVTHIHKYTCTPHMHTRTHVIWDKYTLDALHVTSTDNNQEGFNGAGDRHFTSAEIDERTQMEIYFPPYEGAVKI